MLVELSIRDFAIIDELRIEFEPGLNVLTGETGAGKSIIIDALGAVLGERIGADVVRSGARSAFVEAIFDVTGMAGRTEFAALAEEFDLDLSEGTVALSREVAAGGRSTARINGRATTAGALAKAGASLVDIHGQSDHLSLLRTAGHLDLLDRFAGTIAMREEAAAIVRQIYGVRASLDSLMTGERERERQIDLLQFQAGEIADASLSIDEEESLATERDVLSNTERLAEEAALAYTLLTGGETEEGGVPAVEALQRASVQLDAIAAVDSSMAGQAERLREMSFLLEDVAFATRDYRDRIEADPDRLAVVEDRLELIRKLKRKYGATIAEILAYGDTANAELARLTGGEFDTVLLQGREDELLRELASVAGKLSKRRQAAAQRLEIGVEATISELNMGRAKFAVAIERRPSERGMPLGEERVAFDETGIDRVEFLLAANTGEPLKPLARVASGGETARLMLALKSILAVADETPTLVFDEVDVGVGGRSGQIVGEKLWGLTAEHQVIVITHLPQIAAFAEAHFRITKAEREGRTVSNVGQIAGDDRVDEIAAMLDGNPITAAARENARQMLERAVHWKSNAGVAA